MGSVCASEATRATGAVGPNDELLRVRDLHALDLIVVLGPPSSSAACAPPCFFPIAVTIRALGFDPRICLREADLFVLGEVCLDFAGVNCVDGEPWRCAI